jgi:hypothetical protein
VLEYRSDGVVGGTMKTAVVFFFLLLNLARIASAQEIKKEFVDPIP